jgi:hypothetical protein
MGEIGRQLQGDWRRLAPFQHCFVLMYPVASEYVKKFA